MNIPDKIKIGWKEYTVEKAIPVDKLIAESHTKVCYGEIKYNDNIITLNDNYSEEQQLATFIHEVLHGISNMYVLDIDESLIIKLSNALFTTLKDNPNLLK